MDFRCGRSYGFDFLGGFLSDVDFEEEVGIFECVFLPSFLGLTKVDSISQKTTD